MFHPIKKLYRPELFQGGRRLGKPSPYFEGWYFKAAFPDFAFAVIPGVSLAADDAHGFVQVLGGCGRGGSGAFPETARYHRFEPGAFSCERDDFRIALGGNRFSLRAMEVDLDGFRASLKIGSTFRWPSTLLSPSSMGWYSFMRVMECYHGVIVLDGDVEGRINGELYADGRFYLEKDWGTSFPRAWIWMQSNSFSERASLTCSVARVPFRSREFTGFIIGLYSGGRLHAFTTYNGARLTRIRYDGSSVELRANRGDLTLRIRARREAGVQLASPVRGEMRGRIEETLGSEIFVKLDQNGRLLFADRGFHAGLEMIDPGALLEGVSTPKSP